MRARGQSLLETLLALGVCLIALAAVTTALTLAMTHGRPFETRLIALDAANNVATELFAATAYDPAALSRLRSARWTVKPPAPPSPAPSPDGATLTLDLSVAASGEAQLAQIHVTGVSTTADATFALRFVAPPPGAIVDLPGSPPPR